MRIEHWWFKLPLRLKSIFRRRRVENELDEELQFHLEQKIEEGIAEGLSPEEARYRALRAMGGLEQRKEEIRDTRRIHWLTDFVDDVRYAVRSLRRTPGLAVFVVVTIALGIGMTATPFSMLDALIFRPYPVPRPGDVVTLVGTSHDSAFDPFSYREYLDIRDRTKSYDGVIANVPAADRRLQRASATPRPSRRADCSSPATTSACSTSSRRSGAGSGTTKTRCPAATPWWSFRPDFWKREFAGDPVRRRPDRPPERKGLHRHRRRCRRRSPGSTSSTVPTSTCRSRWRGRSRPTRGRTSSSTATTAS